MRIVKMNDRKVTFVNAAREMLGDRTVITRQEMLAVREACGINPTWIKKLKTGNRGEYYLPSADGKIEDGAIATSVTQIAEAVATSVQMAPSAIGVMEEQDSYIPGKFDGYVPWGNFNMVKQVVKSRMFYPLFVTGLSGNGKTLMVKEVCSRLNREYVRANITI